MNISIIFIVAIGFCSLINSSQHTLKGNSSNISLNFNVQSPEAKQELTPVIAVEEGFFKRLQNVAWQDTMTSQWKKYRFYCFLIVLTSGYGYLWYQLHQARSLLDDAQAWSCWKNHIDVDRLVTYSRDELSKELFIDIQERYINVDDPTNHLFPLAAFLPMIERERILLERYVWWSSKIIPCRIYLLFPTNKESVDLAAQALRRLKFIKGLFVAWWAVHNSQQNMPIKF